MSSSNARTGDMRRSQRLQVSGTIRAIDRRTRDEVGKIVNISADGIMLLGEQPVEENSILELVLVYGEAGTETIAVGVESLWCHSSDDQRRFWSGHYIIDISEPDLERLLGLASPRP